MFKLHIVQADHGDCYLLEYGEACSPRAVLVDGGPSSIYDLHLRHALEEQRERGGKLSLMVLTHIDDDHIAGLLKLMIELRHQRMAGLAETIGIEQIWHNTFSQVAGDEVEHRFATLARQASGTRGLSPLPEETSRSVRQGDELTQHAVALRIPINAAFGPYAPITVEKAQQPPRFDNLTLHVLGPNQKMLEKLRKAWLKWLREQEKRLQAGTRGLVEMVDIDQSVPNLSSIMLLAEADGKTILMTGDGTSDQVLQGLQQANLLDADGRLHVDILKLPHHGSQRNVKKCFLARITADHYIISANGRHHNPDFTTLRWIVETAKAARRAIDIYVTNATDSTRQLTLDYPPERYGYRLHIMPPEAHAMTLALAE
jgi:beta-lactamase superfamily II metal-dependent hydrolase